MRALILFLLLTSQAFALDVSPDGSEHEYDVDSALQANGYIASARLARLMHCEDLVPKLIEIVKEPGRLKKIEDNSAGQFHTGSALQHWHIEMIKTTSSIEVNFLRLGEKTVLSGLPYAVKELSVRAAKHIGPGRYYAKIILISDMHYQPPSEYDVYSTWHQDKSADELNITMNNQTMSFDANYNHLFFLELYRKKLGNSSLKVGLVSKHVLKKPLTLLGALQVPYDAEEKIIQMVKIKYAPGAGYFINQDFETNGMVIVHRSPTLKKSSTGSRRYKLIMRIRRLDDSAGIIYKPLNAVKTKESYLHEPDQYMLFPS